MLTVSHIHDVWKGDDCVYLDSVDACMEEIKAYCERKPTGYAMLVDTENYDVFHSILSRLQGDHSKQCIFASMQCKGSDVPPIAEDLYAHITGKGSFVLVGISQLMMLRGEDDLNQAVGKLLEISVRGHAVILLDHCQDILKTAIERDPYRVDRRIALVKGNWSNFPKIHIAKNDAGILSKDSKKGISGLLSYLENLTDSSVLAMPEITVLCNIPLSVFKNSMYAVLPCAGPYQALIEMMPEIASRTEENFGTEEQWLYLAELVQTSGSLSSTMQKEFGAVQDLSSCLGDVYSSIGDKRLWLYWIGLKVYGTSDDTYLAMAVRNSHSSSTLERHIYMDLLELNCEDKRFTRFYRERKRLISMLPENIAILDQYCNRVGRYEKAAPYYLTDASPREELEFMKCLNAYEYSQAELDSISTDTFPSIREYLRPFTFHEANMKLPAQDVSLYDVFTDYFRQYKLQKVLNRIRPEFQKKVEEFATLRPYNKLQARPSTVKKVEKDGSQLIFFDALGVEYLSYIQSRCEQFGLMVDISVAQCNLPSITSKNKEFLASFSGVPRSIKELDDLKHHSTEVDYQKCKLPVHLFMELRIIEKVLRDIQSELSQGRYSRAVIIADHGASRLAVIHETEDKSHLKLDEKGEHSGRCCPVDYDPKIPFAAYENGYAILANYDRFRGGRKANVEVHGGASLEEVLVPVVVVSKKPDKIELRFVSDDIILHGKEVASITLFSNIPLTEPKMYIDGEFIVGEFVGDSKHAKFSMPKIKRTRKCVVDIFDGARKIGNGLTFNVKKAMGREADDFF